MLLQTREHGLAQSRERTLVVGVRGDRLCRSISSVTPEKLLPQLPLQCYLDMGKKGCIRSESVCQTFRKNLKEAKATVSLSVNKRFAQDAPPPRQKNDVDGMDMMLLVFLYSFGTAY